MDPKPLSDENVIPDEDLVYSLIGEKKMVWQQTMAYLYDTYEDVSEVWKYYKDGKSWLFRTLKKKKTIFWISIIADTFRIAFWFADKLEPEILKSDLPERIKQEYKNAKRFNKSRCIFIDIQDADDLQNVKKLIDLKILNLK